MGDEDAILASQQFLIPFVATILGTLTGVAGLLLAVRPLMPEGFFWQCAIIVAILGATLIGVFRFYKWAVKHMLTEKQRSALETKYNFEF